MTGRGDAANPPVLQKGQSLTYFNEDAPRVIEHTITACKAPCNRTTGIAYPLADADVQFDSGQLGFGPPGITAAANRDTWETPKNLDAGTYTYFCRVHPFMRGSFRVKE
jgi:plastocyanin